MYTILIVDDNADIRENTAEILEWSGYKAITAENGRKGVEKAIKEKPDLIVCDIMMPELDGYGVLHLIRKNPETQFIPFIFLSAKAERGDFRKGMEMGADDYISKPFDDIELLTAIEIRLRQNKVLNTEYHSDISGVRSFLEDIKSLGLVSEISSKYDSQIYRKKQFLYEEGKKARFLYYVISGKIKAFKNHEIGKEYISDLYNSGDFVGYSSIIADEFYDDSAEIIEDADILQIPKDDFLKMVYGDIRVAARFMQIITHNVKEKENRLLDIAYSSLRKRVANALLSISDKLKTSEGERLIGISREEIAQYVGTATESLIRTISDFKTEKLIEIKEGKITIPNPDNLAKLRY